VHVGVDFPDEDEELDFLSNSNKFIAVLKLVSFYPYWKKMSLIESMAKRQLIEGQLDRFVMLDDEDPQEMYNGLKKLANKVRVYGSKRWGEWRVIDRLL
jgi:hypothetical protein